MRHLRNLKASGLIVSLTVLLFTTVFSQERSVSENRSDPGTQSVERRERREAVREESPDRRNPASSRDDRADANSGAKESPVRNSELAVFVRKSMVEHPILTNLCILGVLIGAVLLNLIMRRIFQFVLKKGFQRFPIYDDEGKKLLCKTAARLSFIVPIVLFYVLLEMLDVNPANLIRIRKICMVLTLICAVAAGVGILNILDLWYRNQSNSHSHSIKGGIQLLQIFAVIVALIMIASILMNRSPVILLSSLGAVAAVLILIFQDTLLALASGIQLSTNHMIRLGDWIVLPSENVDGIIIDIALHTVKVQNWDMTIVTVPTRKLTVETFINWRGVFESGGRRIKRAINIDVRSIHFLDDDEIARLKDFVLLDGYLDEKRHEIEDWNHTLEAKGAKPVNGRHITNIGTFRIYIEKYLRSLSTVNQNLTLMVRQLAPEENGLPIEVICFTNTTKWIEYERIQSDIFDHLLAILPFFGLRVFQRSSDIVLKTGADTAKIPLTGPRQ